jgi:hypothetical protein
MMRVGKITGDFMKAHPWNIFMSRITPEEVAQRVYRTKMLFVNDLIYTRIQGHLVVDRRVEILHFQEKALQIMKNPIRLPYPPDVSKQLVCGIDRITESNE